MGSELTCGRCTKSFTVLTVRTAENVLTTPFNKAVGAAEPKPETTPAPRHTPLPASGERTLRTLGRFELKAILGQGAFGRVYRAYDPQLDRYVALKVPTFSLEDQRRVIRFVTEARAAARLRHPNIVPTYESGKIGGQYYIAAQFVNGMPLSRRIREAPPDFRQAMLWVRQLADALSYAHSEGIVHRDIKPDNIMLDEKLVPQIMDFGLARRTDEDAVMTTDGSIMGTPAYMSPEQARGDIALVGPASDQFSLGVVMYELLVGRRPFDGTTHAVISQVIGTEPPPPRSLCPDLPRDLEAICLKAMEKDPAQRYATAADLSADVGRWLEGAPIHARTTRLWERAWKWSKRNPAIASLSMGLAAVAVLAFVAVSSALGVAMISRRQEISQRIAAERATEQARELAESLEQQKAELQQTLANLRAETKRADTKTTEAGELDTRLQLVQGSIAAAERRMKEALQAERVAADKAIEAKSQADAALRRVAQETHRVQDLLAKSYFDLGLRRCEDGKVGEGALWLVRSLETLPPEDKEQAAVIEMALTQYLATDKAAETAPAKLRLALEHDRPVTAAVFHTLEPLLVSGDNWGQIHLWDTSSGKKLETVAGHTKRVRYIGFSPTDPALFVSGGEDTALIAWRVTKDRKLELLVPKMQHAYPITTASWSAEGRWILTGSDQARRMQLWNAATRRAMNAAFGNDDPGRIFSVAMHPGEERLSSAKSLALVGTGLLDKSVRLWDVMHRKPLPGKEPLTLSGDVRAVEFSPDGNLAIALTEDKKGWLIDVMNWELARQDFAEFQSRPLSAAWSAIHSVVLVGCEDRTAVLWDPATNQHRGEPILHNGPVNAVQFHPSGDEFLTASEDRTVRIWTMTRKRQRRELEAGNPVTALAVSPDGRQLVAVHGRDLSVWSTDRLKRVAEIRDKTSTTYSIAFAPDGRTVLLGDTDSARLWDARTWKPVGLEMPHTDRILSVAYSRDLKWLATASADRTARVWNAQSQAPIGKSLSHPDRVTSVAFSPDGLQVATGSTDGHVRIWEISTPEKPLHDFPAESLVHAVGYSADAKFLGAACENGSLFVWNLKTGQAIGNPLVHAGAVRWLSFIPRSNTLLSGSADGVHTLSALTNQPIGPATNLRGQVVAAAISHDGATVAAVTENQPKAIAVWGLTRPIERSRDWLATWVKVVSGRQLTPSGAISALSAAELTAAQARLASLEREAASAE